MTSPFDPDRLITSWLDERAPTREPDDLLRQVLTETSRTGRRPGWIIPERWIPMSLFLNPQAAARATVAVMAVILALGTGAAFVLAAPAPTVVPDPSPRPVASPDASPLSECRHRHRHRQAVRNGLIAFEALHLSGKGSATTPTATSGSSTRMGPGPGRSSPDRPTTGPRSGRPTGPGSRTCRSRQATSRFKDPVSLMVANADGSDPIAIATTQDYPPSVGAFVWSPDGTMIAMPSDGANTQKPYFSIIDSRSGETLLHHVGAGMAWAPDSRRIAFVYGDDNKRLHTRRLDVIDLHGTVKTLVAHPEGYPSAPAWSPDGTRLAYLSSDSGSPRAGGRQIMVLDLATGEQRDISGPSGGRGFSGWRPPQWSPDGTRILYHLDDRPGDSRVVDLGPGRLDAGATGRPGWHATWSPDSSSILYWDDQVVPGGQLFVVDASGATRPNRSTSPDPP